MSRFWIAAIGLALGLSAGIASAAESRMGAFYEIFQAGDPVTDQAAGAPGKHSTLVGYEGRIPAATFVAKVAKPALAAEASLYLVLNECYGGGFITHLAPLGGTQFVFTAARHSETASYGLPAPSGVDIDSTDAFLTALGDGKVPAQKVAEASVALNPFGPNPKAKRLGETMGREHAQYFVSQGGEKLKVADHGRDGIAVLWVGSPAERDGVQMNRLIDRLLAMGFSPEKIWLLYGGGTVTESHIIAKSQLVGKTQPIHLEAATQENLFTVFSNAFERNPVPPSFVFFYAGDHGGLGAQSAAKIGFEADPLVAPNFVSRPGMRIFGEGL